MIRFTTASALVVALARGAEAQNYLPVDLDPAGTFASASIAHLADGGHPVGYAKLATFGPNVAVEFRPTGPVQLALLAQDFGAIAIASNAAGIIVGKAVVANPFAERGRVWVGGQPFELDSLVNPPSLLKLTSPSGIDDENRIIGTAEFQSNLRAFLFEGGVVTDLHLLAPPAVIATAAEAISSTGAIVGWVQVGPTALHACKWENGVFSDLNDPAQGNNGLSLANDVDRFGRACGQARFGPGTDDHAALFENGAMIDLGAIGSESRAFGMNDLGDIVGESGIGSTFSTVATLWRNGAPIDLNSLIPAGSGWALESAQDIDNAGRIAGWGHLNGAIRPFLLQPVCGGGYTVTAPGCPTPAGKVPKLSGLGCPEVGAPVALVFADGPADATGLLCFGLGNGTLPFSPSCALGIAPLLPSLFPIGLDSAGSLFVPAVVPAAASGTTARLQAILLPPGGPNPPAATNALTVSIP